MKKSMVSTFVAVPLFLISQKVGIECMQSGFEIAGFCLILVSHILKLIFLILLILFMIRVLGRLNIGVRIIVGILCLPIFIVSCAVTMISGRIILDFSRPARPGAFIKDRSVVNKLTDLSCEMIQNKRIFWVGNGWNRFVFSIKYEDGDYQFDSRLIPDDHDFNKPVDAEDMSEVRHHDLPFQSKALRITDRKILDPNDYDFCKRASGTIRKIGFDNVKLYPEKNVVQYQIHNFFGWDSGWYNVYYFYPGNALPEEFKYSRKLNSNWYYNLKTRFAR